MIENGFNYAVEQAVKADKKKKAKKKPKRIKLREKLMKNHGETIKEKGFANVDCSAWNKTDQKRMLELIKLDGYKENVIKRLWKLTKL